MGKLLRLSISLAALAILAGCATTQWVKAGADSSTFYVEEAQCNVQAMTAKVSPYLQLEIKTECLKGKGWYRVDKGSDPALSPLLQNNRSGLGAGQSCRRESDCQSGLSCRSVSGGGAACR